MNITAKHHQAILLISQGKNGVNTAKEIGITPECLSGWRQQFEFQALLNKVLIDNQVFNENKLRALNSLALTTLEDILLDSDNPRERLAACLKVLEICKTTTTRIGHTDVKSLEKEKAQDDLLNSYGL